MSIKFDVSFIKMELQVSNLNTLNSNISIEITLVYLLFFFYSNKIQFKFDILIESIKFIMLIIFMILYKLHFHL